MKYFKQFLNLNRASVPKDILKAYSLLLESHTQLEKQSNRVGKQNMELALKVTQLEDELRKKDDQIGYLQTRLRVDKSFLHHVA